jgi:nucleoside-diphosphate-sugar epimerase
VWCISPRKPGVRYSLSKLLAYLDSNLGGFLNVLESCRHNPPEHLISASAYRSIRRRMSP